MFRNSCTTALSKVDYTECFASGFRDFTLNYKMACAGEVMVGLSWMQERFKCTRNRRVWVKTSTLNPQPSTLNPQPSALDPQPSTLDPQPSALDSQPPTLNLPHYILFQV
jgi:hypothetical protein